MVNPFLLKKIITFMDVIMQIKLNIKEWKH
jgi:hypothetical protein